MSFMFGQKYNQDRLRDLELIKDTIDADTVDQRAIFVPIGGVFSPNLRCSPFVHATCDGFRITHSSTSLVMVHKNKPLNPAGLRVADKKAPVRGSVLILSSHSDYSARSEYRLFTHTTYGIPVATTIREVSLGNDVGGGVILAYTLEIL